MTPMTFIHIIYDFIFEDLIDKMHDRTNFLYRLPWRKILTASVTSNMNKSVTFFLLFISPLLVASFSLNAANKWKNEVPDEPALRIGRSLALNDFEAGTFGSWVDVSAADAKWNIEDFSNPIDPSQPAPAPLSGNKYLRVSRPAGSSGMAVLRSEPFTVDSGDQVSLSFWIRSQIIQTNNLEVYYVHFIKF